MPVRRNLFFLRDKIILVTDDTNMPIATGLKRRQLSVFENCFSHAKSIL
jgi:hypothetical protein